MSRYGIVTHDFGKLTAILKKLHRLGVQRKNMHISIEGEDHLEMAQMLEKSIFKTTDLLNSLVRGAVIGGITGLLIGLLIKQQFSDYFSEINIVFVITVLGLLFGAWASSLIGVSVPNAEVEKFDRALDRGAVVLWVEIPGQKERVLLDSLKLQYPDIIIQSA